MTISHSSMRILIVEDEPHARRYLRELLAGERGWAVVGEAANGAEGAELIRRLQPELVFLDIQMPDLNGFDLIAEIGMATMPAFVFVSAYSEYAVRAFEVEAVDYLCKPFDRDRLSIALERAIRRLQRRETATPARTTDRESEAAPARQWLSRITIKEEDGIVFVPVGDVVWIEAANKYVVIHTSDRTYVARQTIQSLEERLDPRQFVRIHRSVIVRKAAVRGLHPLLHGDYIVKLNEGTELTLSRNYRESFFRQMSR